MKIGILTFHRAHNYGAVLQAYALQETLLKYGHSVEFVDYYNPQMLRIYNWFELYRLKTKCPKAFIRELLLLSNRKKRYDNFKNFIKKKLILSPAKYDLLSYDIIFVGSDQVWNSKLTLGFDDMYWGNFSHPQSLKIASYAASMEEDIPAGQGAQVSVLLDNFDYISVREKSLADKLSTMTAKTVYVVSDPTLLLHKEDWEKEINLPIIKQRYVLLYQVRNNPRAESMAKEISQRMNLDIVYLSARVDLRNSKNAVSAGPQEFLNLFKYASYVVCTSFHGTVFSIIFNIPFVSVLLNDGKDSRVKDLLGSLDLQERGLSIFQDSAMEPIDWKHTNDKLDDLRSKSIDYLNMVCK